MVAIIGGDFHRFRPLADLYREAGRRAGHAPGALTVGVHAMGFVGDTDDAAKDAFFPGWAYMFTEIGRERGWSRSTRRPVRGDGGVMVSSTLGAGRPENIGDPYLLNAFASVFIGASTLRPGRFHILGTTVGVLLIGVIDNGLSILGVATFCNISSRAFFSFRRSLLPAY